MKLSKELCRFPKTLPNDLEGFNFFYPHKYPPIISYYEEVAQKVGGDPDAYEEYGDWARDELYSGFEKINKDYQDGDQSDLAFLVATDQRFNKLFCYRFWPVNYLFADGPIHTYFVDSLKALIYKIVDVGEDVESYESRIAQLHRDLLQSDYADLYLQQALKASEVARLLESDQRIAEPVSEIKLLIAENAVKNTDQINSLWQKVVDLIYDKGKPNLEDPLVNQLAIPLEQALFRGSMMPVYNMLTHALEFAGENEVLAERHGAMSGKIDEIMDTSRQRLNPEEFELFKTAYLQSRNFAKYKDVMGSLDPQLLPTWFGIHDKIRNIIFKDKNVPYFPTGHASIFYYFSWHIPGEFKAIVFTPDTKPFSLENL